MNHLTRILLAVAVVSTPLITQASCESVKADINGKIVRNGVPADGFTLEIIPNDQVNQSAGAVVGHCENDTQKIVYRRLDKATDDVTLPPDTGSGHDAPATK